MEQLLEQVGRARRKLWLELFVNRLLRCWFFALLAAVVAIAVPKLFVVENLPENWPLLSMAIALGIGLVAALVWTYWSGRSQLDAAQEIDRRYDLKERVASCLSLDSKDVDTPAGQALLDDAVRAVKRVDIDERFQLRLSKRPWLPLVPALLAFLLAAFVDNREAQSSADPNAQKITKEQHENATKALRERMKKLREKAAEKKELAAAEGLFKELEKKAEEMTQVRKPDRKKSLVKLNDLADQLQKRREQLGSKQDLRKQMEKLNNLNKGPADKMVEAMKQGEWKKAIQELNKLKQQMEKGELSKENMKQLQEQLKQIQEKMSEAAESRKQAMEELKKQIEQQKQQGNLSRAGELQEKLEKMQQQQNKMNKLNDLAKKMGECQECMKEGNAEGAKQALDQMMQQMEQMQQDMQEGEMLDAAMDQLQMAKDAMRCSECQGQGCEDCNGGMGNQYSEKLGNGMGLGRGGGKRPDEKNDVNFRDSRVRQKPRNGKAVVVGEVDGPNFRGQVVESIKEQMISQGSEPADPLTIEQLPKSRREHAEQYFNSLREGR